MFRVVSINKENESILSDFLIALGNQPSFRYFESRTFDALNNHLCTYVVLFDNKPVGYGHLDRENGITWLGIAIIDAFQGYGIGKLIMSLLLSHARLHSVESIRLSVDNDNLTAIKLYEKLGFRLIEKRDKFGFYEHKL